MAAATRAAARGARRARAAHRASLSASRRAHGAARSVRLGARRSRGRKARPRSCSPARAAGRSCRISTRATARPPPRALIARLQGARAAPAACWSATPACRRPRWSSTCCMTPGAPRRADAAGLQQDAHVSRVARRARRRHASRSSTTAIARRSRRRSGPRRAFVFAETFTNPLVRAQDLAALRELVRDARAAPGAAAGDRLDDRHAVGVPHAAARRRASTSCSPAAPRRSAAPTATLGLHRHQRHAARQRRHGSDGDARRHPRLAARRRRSSAASTHAEARARAALGDRQPRRGVPRRHPTVSEVFHPSLPDAPGRRGDRRALHAARLAAVVPRRRRRRGRARATSPTCSRRATIVALRAVVRRARDQGEPPQDRVGVLHAADRAAAQRLRSADPPGVGIEDADDLIAALNWTLHHGDAVTPAEIERVAAGASRVAGPRRCLGAVECPPGSALSRPAVPVRPIPGRLRRLR